MGFDSNNNRTECEQNEIAPHGLSYAQIYGSQWAHFENYVPVHFKVSVF
jgi:hypothetical protein